MADHEMDEAGALLARLWARDVTLWKPGRDNPAVAGEIADRLGWLDVFDWLPAAAGDLEQWAAEVAKSGRFSRVVVLGMGGSSLAPLVLSRLFPARDPYPTMSILDSTAPAMVREIVDAGVSDTLFIVASKSGTTLETMDLYRFFHAVVARGTDSPGGQFIAITDPGSWLAQHASEAGFANVFLNPATIGGRYSALSYFGLVPAALHGIDVVELVSRAAASARAMQSGEDLQAARLGVMMAEQTLAGRDKMFLNLPQTLQPLGAWIEQLVAESTGKDGTGVVPVCGDAPSHHQGGFELTISSGADKIRSDQAWTLAEPLDIGREFLRWECATAIACSQIDVNPFDQPNVAEAKASTSRFIAGQGSLPELSRRGFEGFSIEMATVPEDLVLPVAADAGQFIALLGYLPICEEIEDALAQVASKLKQRYGAPVTTGFGPRYLHSTGQLHKGGKPDGVFILLSYDDTEHDIAVPGRDYGFNSLINAQADGDHAVLLERDLPVMRVRLEGEIETALEAFASAIAD